MRRVLDDGTGPFTTAHALAWGLTRDDMRSAVRSGQWLRLRHGIFVTAGDRALAAASNQTLHAQDVQALRLAMSRRRLVAAGTSAAQIYGLDLRSTPTSDLVVVTDDPGVASTHRDGYFLRVAHLPDEHVLERHGVPITSPARTLIDLAAHRGFDDGLVASESAYRSKLITRDELLAAVDDSEGRPGIHVVRDCLSFADPDSGSVLESVSRITMRALGIPMPLTQVVLVDDGYVLIRVDFLWPWLRLVGEADGMAKYSLNGRQPLAALRAEREREQMIRDLDWDIVRWDWRIANDPRLLGERLNAAFARAAERLQGRAN